VEGRSESNIRGRSICCGRYSHLWWEFSRRALTSSIGLVLGLQWSSLDWAVRREKV